MQVSIVIPAKNEAGGLSGLLPELVRLYPLYEVLIVNDGSSDDTLDVCRANGVRVVNHPYSKGNGAAIKAGARAAAGDIIVFMDADGQHAAADVARLLAEMDKGYDLVVGARKTMKDQANIFRGLANRIYNKLASFMVGHEIEDLTSGMRAVKRDKFIGFLSLLPNGFSYPTTSTMAFFRSGFSVGYIPIEVAPRIGTSHIHLLKDGVRFLLIIFKVSTLYSPLKMFVPLSVLIFLLGMARYFYTFQVSGSFTNMSALLLISSLLIFLIGLVSEQITSLIYLSVENKKNE